MRWQAQIGPSCAGSGRLPPGLRPLRLFGKRSRSIGSRRRRLEIPASESYASPPAVPRRLQCLEHIADGFQLVLFADGDQQLCVLVEADGRWGRVAQHLPAGFNGCGDVIDAKATVQVRRQRVEAGNLRGLLGKRGWRQVGLIGVEVPDRVISWVAFGLEAVGRLVDLVVTSWNWEIGLILAAGCLQGLKQLGYIHAVHLESREGRVGELVRYD